MVSVRSLTLNLDISEQLPLQTKMYFEDQKSIVEWQNDTFGEPEDIRADYARANEEALEFLLTASIHKKVEEAADILIVLSRPAEYLGVDLHSPWPRLENKCVAELVIEVAQIMSKLMIDMLVHPQTAGNHMREVSTRLYDYTSRVGFDLRAAIDDKMARNRKRRWAKNGKGQGYHI